MFNRLHAFMAGRNGIDRLAGFYIIVAVILNIVARTFFLIPLAVVSVVFIILAALRILSRNIAKRQEENYRFVRIWGDLIQGLHGWRDWRRQSREYRFYNCPECKSRLRVARGKGKVQITCPRCGRRFTKKT